MWPSIEGSGHIEVHTRNEGFGRS